MVRTNSRITRGECGGGFIRIDTRTASRNGGPKVPHFRVSLLSSPPIPPPRSAERFRAPVIESALLAQDLRSPYTWSAGANTAEHASWWRDDDRARFNRVCSLEVTAEIDWRTLIVLFRVRRAWLERNSPLLSAIAYRIDDDNEVGWTRDFLSNLVGWTIAPFWLNNFTIFFQFLLRK